MSQRLGQNFLKDPRALERIAGALNISPEDIVIEIGPGHGELTRRLLKYAPKRLIGVELDKNLIKIFLDDILKDHSNLEIVNADIKEYLPGVALKKYKLVGNIPYYLTSHLLRIISELENKPELIVLTTQKEVAKRICADPPKMNLLSAMTRTWGAPEIVRYISKKSFKPVPRVDSAIIKITPHKKGKGYQKLEELISILFSHPRKTVLNNLKPLTKDRSFVLKKLEDLGLKASVRPQDLSLEDIENIYKVFHTTS